MTFTCDAFDLEPIKFSSQKFHRARTTHKCFECGHVIMPGEEYEYFSGKWNGSFSVIKTCERCADLLEAFRDLGFRTVRGELFQDYADWLEDTLPCPEDDERTARERAWNLQRKHRLWDSVKCGR